MTKQPKKKPKYKSTIGRTLHYFIKANKNYKWLALGVFIVTPIVIFVRTILAPLVVANIIDILSSARPEDFINPGNIFQIPLVQKVLPQGIFLILCQLIGSSILGNLRVYLVWKMELLTINDLSIQCFDTINNQSMQFHSDRFSGSLTAQVGRFTRAYERFADSIVFNIVPLIVTFSSIFIILINRAPAFAILLMIFSAVFAIVSSRSFKRIGECNEKEAAAQNKQTGQLTDSITNIISVKSYAQENYERTRYTKFQAETLAAGENSMRATIHRDVIFDSIFLLIDLIMIAFIVVGAPVMALPVSTVILIFQFSQTILMNLWDISSIFKNFTRVFGDAHEMTIILDTVDTVVDEKGAKKLIVDKGGIAFDHITFTHADAKESIFKDFNLELKPGERIGLAGLSGSGKTTLTKLLLRFADVDEGVIKIDDQNIRKVTQHSLRKNIAYVPQEASLFHRTIAENIAYAKPDASMEEIKHAAKLANAAEFIEKLPNGYETMVGERGVKLSGGQRQRIAIARAILKDSPVVILDEATAFTDPENESIIQHSISELVAGKTLIVIAHRLSTITSADKIIVMNAGNIEAEGKHEELTQNCALYKELWNAHISTLDMKEVSA